MSMPPPAEQQPQTTAQNPSNTLSIIGIVCGVIALLFIPPLFGIAGVVLGVVARSKGERLGTIAIIVAAIGLVVGMILGYVVFSASR